ALPTLARVRLQRLSSIGNRRNPPPRAENAANFFRSSARASGRSTAASSSVFAKRLYISRSDVENPICLERTRATGCPVRVWFRGCDNVGPPPSRSDSDVSNRRMHRRSSWGSILKSRVHDARNNIHRVLLPRTFLQMFQSHLWYSKAEIWISRW